MLGPAYKARHALVADGCRKKATMGSLFEVPPACSWLATETIVKGPLVLTSSSRGSTTTSSLCIDSFFFAKRDVPTCRERASMPTSTYYPCADAFVCNRGH